MISLLDPKVDEEEEEEPEEKWYAVIMYDDASAIWHLSEHPTKEEAMATLRDLVFDSMGGNDEDIDEDDEDDEESFWRRTREEHGSWTLSDMNEHLPGEHNINTVFCKKGGTE